MQEQNEPSPPRLRDWAGDLAIPFPALGETLVLRVDLNPRPSCADFEKFPEWEVLSEEERVRARRFVRFRDGRRFAICRGSLRLILGRLTDTPPASVMFRFGPGGKPELVPSDPLAHGSRPRFNLSHSGDLALIAVNGSRELGVDLEEHKSIAEAARIVGSYFTRAEQDQFAALDERVSPSAFLRGWTRKEAILKAQGVGLAGLANRFETMFGTDDLDDRFRPTTPFPQIGEWWLWEAAPRSGYYSAVAVQDARSLESASRAGLSSVHEPSLRGGQEET